MTTPASKPATTGASLVGIGAAACAACCAVPAFGFLTALVAGASALALVAGGVLLAVAIAAAGAGFLAWRRRRAARTRPAATSAPVSFPARSGRS